MLQYQKYLIYIQKYYFIWMNSPKLGYTNESS